LRALHDVSADEATRLGAGPDTLRRLEIPLRLERAERSLAEIARLALFDADRLRAALTEAGRDVPPARARCLVHGDFYARHVLVDDAGVATGIIDWGDLHVGDPANDLSIAHGLLPPEARGELRAAYGEIDDGTWRLARFKALYYCALLIPYAHATADAGLAWEIRTSLGWLLE
jgi:aminoglycoside phosphotransferase (APT) family kinase protein